MKLTSYKFASLILLLGGSFSGMISSAIRAEPTLEDLLLPGMNMGMKGDYQGAIAEFTDVINQYPEAAAEAYYNRGIARNRAGDWTGAIADYNYSLSLNPNFAEVYVERGLLRFQWGDKTSALKDLEKAAQLFIEQENPTAYHLTQEHIKSLYYQPR